MRLLFEKGLLLKVFTQNIDCLEREAGVPDDKIVEAHGSFARQCCIECKTPYPHDLMKEAIEKRNVPHCLTPQCNGLVKPEIVFFGEGLPEEFHKNRALPTAADLCIVMGTSLSVQPFASLPDFCSEGVPRVLLNLEHVGSLGSRPDDVLLLGDCDAGVRKLASALGWLEELEAVWIQTSPDDGTKQGETTPIKSKDEILEDEIAKLTKEVDKSLQISSIHTASLRDDLSEIQKKRLHANAIKGTDSSGGSSHSYPSDVTISSSTDQKKPAVDDLQISRSKERTATDVGESKGSLLEHVLSHNEGKSSL